MAKDVEHITGCYKSALDLVSGKYALVETVIEKELGRTVSGLMRGDGISWETGRSLGIGV